MEVALIFGAKGGNGGDDGFTGLFVVHVGFSLFHERYVEIIHVDVGELEELFAQGDIFMHEREAGAD